MNGKLRTLSTATALVAGLAAGALVPATAGATPSTQVTPELLSAMQRDLGLTPEQAHHRLALEAAAAHVESSLRQELGHAFGGAWLDVTSGRLVVGITDPALAGRVRHAGAEPSRVTWTEQQLDAVKTALDRNATRASKSIHGWYVDAPTNSVVILADASAQEHAAAFAAESGSAHGGRVRVVLSQQAPRPLYDLRGGDAYYPGGYRCSIGFSVSGGFVTAGHCGAVGTTTSGYNGVGQGIVRGSSFPGNDYGWVQVNASWASRPWVNNYSGSNLAVTGSREASVYSSVCRSGSTTGWRCGTIQARNVTVNYAQGAVHGLTQTSACAEGGDSGGAWLSGNQAQGVTSGGSGNCTTGGTTFFQPLNPILSAYGLSLTTSGGSEIVGLASKCIDVSDANTANGTPLQLWDCNGTAAQSWHFASDGSIQALGKCMDVSNANTASGTPIQLWECNGTAAQKFVLNGAGDLVNVNANKCVDVTNGDPATGTRLQLWDCNGTAAQKWYLR